MENGAVTLTTRSEQLDGKGKVEAVTEKVERVTSEGGSQNRELVRFVRDGRDVTAAEKERAAEREAERKAGKEKGSVKERGFSTSVKNPFARTEQPRYRFWIIAPAGSGGESLFRIGFAPKEKASPDLNSGEAVVEEATAVLRRLSYRPSRFPEHVKQMDVRVEYGAVTPAGLAISTVTMNAEAGMLFIKKRVRTSTVFSDYRLGN